MIYSRYYPAYHPKAGTPTHFVEKVLNSVGIVSPNDLLPGIKEIINEKELNKIVDWFKHPKPFDGQIICHNNNTKYDSGAI